MTDSQSPTTEAPFGPSAAAFAEAIVETVRTPLLVLDREHRVVAANPAFYRTYSLDAEPVEGRYLFELAGGQWDLPPLRRILEETLEEEEAVRDLEVEAEFAEAGRRIMMLDARQVRLDEVRHPLVLLSLEDVTDRETYERRIEEYARALERSNRDLESFAHAASHDLQEPLRKIRTYVSHISDSLDPELLDERLRRYLKRLAEAAVRLQTRIDDLLQLARVGQAEGGQEPTDLNAEVAAALDDLESAVLESGAHIDVGELPVVRADPSQMRLLFQNLVANGIKFTSAGETPTIRIRSEPAEEDAGSGPSVRIVVEDEGIGFEEEYAERIFRPFERLHGRGDYEGSGVGLAICQRIMEAHGGHIEAYGRAGRGARFVMTLPMPEGVETST